jgi:hypothetical protein
VLVRARIRFGRPHERQRLSAAVGVGAHRVRVRLCSSGSQVMQVLQHFGASETNLQPTAH